MNDRKGSLRLSRKSRKHATDMIQVNVDLQGPLQASSPPAMNGRDEVVRRTAAFCVTAAKT
jgi:hypothetical protein